MKDFVALHLAVQDLKTFPRKDILQLAKYYQINSADDDLYWLLALKILRSVRYSMMDIYQEGDLIELPDPDSDDDVDFVVVRLLGKGMQGTSYIIKKASGDDESEYVLKIIPKKYINELRMFEKIMATNKPSRNIVQIYGYDIKNDGYIYLIMQKVSGVPVDKIISNFPSTDLNTFAMQAISGLNYLHSRNMYHRDIKPDNIIWDEANKRLKYIDFGAACGVGIKCPDIHGAPLYLAPEYLEIMDDYSPDILKALDVYALGVILYQLANNTEHPFPGETDIHSMKDLLTFVRTKPELVSNSGNLKLDQIINSMIKNDPRERITIDMAEEMLL